MTKVFAEIGYGNETFLSTEFEEGEGKYLSKIKILFGVSGLHF